MYPPGIEPASAASEPELVCIGLLVCLESNINIIMNVKTRRIQHKFLFRDMNLKQVLLSIAVLAAAIDVTLSKPQKIEKMRFPEEEFVPVGLQ